MFVWADVITGPHCFTCTQENKQTLKTLHAQRVVSEKPILARMVGRMATTD